MQIDSGNYNTLGRLGPVYPRPEYRPKSPSKDTSGEAGESGRDKVDVANGKGEQSSTKARKDLKAQNRTQAVESGRLNLQSAKSLTLVTAEAISNLPPQGRNQAPHMTQGLGLLSPRYI
jgi:hypothetical protein